MKKIALINSFLDTKETKVVLSKNLDFLKSLGIDTLLISPFNLEEELQNKCDYFFKTKDNLVYEWPKKALFFWSIFNVSGTSYKFNKTVADYGWAALNQVKQLSDIAINLDYDIFFHISYDLKMDDFVIKYLNNPIPNLMFPSKREDTIWKVGLHFSIFDRKNLKKLTTLIDEESYLANTKDNAYEWLEKAAEIMNSETNLPPVEDEIFRFEDIDVFNYSKINGIKFFVDKNDETKETIKIFFYENNQKNHIVELKVGEIHYTVNLQEVSFIDLGVDSNNMREVKIIYDNHQQILTEVIQKIKHNTVEKL